VIADGHGLPYSKGLMAQSLSATGMAPERAFDLARVVERRLADGRVERIGAGELGDLTEGVLSEEEGEVWLRRFRHWRRLDRLAPPCAGVGALPANLDRRVGGRRLLDLTQR